MIPPEDCAGIDDVREAIDGLDREILGLLGQRARYVAAAARFKTDQNDVRAPERRETMLARRRDWAEEEDLDPNFVEDLYGRIVSHFVAREMGRWRKGRA
ncbi:MAG TPA: chorismate mutase [Rubrobacter sp.]|nr:chorismate mutase [Rubrobacter sp.]